MKTLPILFVVLFAGCSSGRRPVVHVTPHEYLAPSAEPVASGVRDLHADVRAVQARGAGAELGDHIIESLGLGSRLAQAASE